MIILLIIISVVLLLVALLLSVISLATFLRAIICSRKEPSTSFFPVLVVCIVSCVLHSKPMPTWFCIVGVATLSITIIEIIARVVNLVYKKTKHKLGWNNERTCKYSHHE